MTIINALPFTFVNGTTADATQVDANFNEVVNDVNNNGAHNGANNDITSLSGLTTPITPAQGGTTSFIGGTSGGSANAQTLANPSPNGFGLTDGYQVSFVAGFTTTGAATLNINSLGAKNFFIATPSGAIAASGGEIVAGNKVEVIYDGTQFQIINSAAQQGGYGPRTTVASNSTMDLGLVPSHNVSISGTTTITAFGANAGLTYPFYQVQFQGILTLTQNAVSLILPGNANITTAAGDQCLAHYLGGGNWRVVAYWKQNGTPVNFNAAFLQGYINGLILSTAGGSGTMTIATGIAADSTNAAMMALNLIYTKTTASWALGTGNGGLDTGAIANTTWYHWYEIQRPDTGVVDIIFSLSASAPALPANYTLYRWLGAMKTDGAAHWLAFTQTGSRFIWSASVIDANATGSNANSARTLLALSVPTGVVVDALFRAELTGVSSSLAIAFTSPQESDQSANSSTFADLGAANGGFSNGDYARLTNTSAQIGWRTTSTGGTFCVVTYGWTIYR